MRWGCCFPSFPPPPGPGLYSFPSGAGRKTLFLSLRRRALAPLAWLRSLRRAGAVAPAGPLRGPVPFISYTLGPPGTRAAGRLLSLSAPGGGEGRGEVGVLFSKYPSAARPWTLFISLRCRAEDSFPFPQAPGARSARLAPRLAARRRGRAGRAATRPGPVHLPHLGGAGWAALLRCPRGGGGWRPAAVNEKWAGAFPCETEAP